MASPFANFKHINVAIDPARYPKITDYVGRILGRPSFKHWVDRETAFLERAA